MTIPDHELPGWLVVIILGLVILCLLLAMAFLGYLPSPLSTKIDAHDAKATRADRASLIACGAMMEVAGRPPPKGFLQGDPGNSFPGGRRSKT